MIIKNSKIITLAALKNEFKEVLSVPKHIKDATTGVVFNKENVEQYRATVDHILATICIDSNLLLELEDIITTDDNKFKITYLYLLSDIVDLGSIGELFNMHLEMIGALNGFTLELKDNKIIFESELEHVYDALDEFYRAIQEFVEDNMNEIQSENLEAESALAAKVLESFDYIIKGISECGLNKEEINPTLKIAKTNKFLAEQLFLRSKLIQA